MLSRAVRNRNPGNLRPRSSRPQWPAQTGIDDAQPAPPFARFSTNADGFCALGLWLLMAHNVWGLTTTTKKIGVFAPPGVDGNNTSAYAAGVAAKVGENADPNDPKARRALALAIAKWESPQSWLTAEINAGMKLSTDLWPDFLAAMPKKLGRR